MNYIFKNGKPATFVSGRFITDIPSEIAELDEEVAAKHPFIFIDPAEKEIDSEKLDPMAGLRERIIAEYLARQAEVTNPTNDMGSTKQEPLKPASTLDIAQAAEGGSGAGLAARLMIQVSKK
jgi:hypothetical protein